MVKKNSRQQRWDQRYREKVFAAPEPAFVLSGNQHLLTSGNALEIASGFGGNALFLAENNYQVDAFDYSEVAMQKLSDYASTHSLAITTATIDLENISLPSEYYDLVIGSYYLQRELLPQLLAALKSGGLFFYQTFSGHCVDGAGPENPDFRLRQGELLTICSGHSILYYREDNGSCQGEACFNGEAMIIARRD